MLWNLFLRSILLSVLIGAISVFPSSYYWSLSGHLIKLKVVLQMQWTRSQWPPQTNLVATITDDSYIWWYWYFCNKVSFGLDQSDLSNQLALISMDIISGSYCNTWYDAIKLILPMYKMQAGPKIDNNITVIDRYNITFCYCFHGEIWVLYHTVQRLWNAVYIKSKY